MRILAIIPARGGSIRLPGKNAKLLLGKPLIWWSIEYAFRIQFVCDVLVTTDSPDLARIARTSGALVPWLRPQHLATAQASSVDVALHALKWYEDAINPVDAILLLQPTSPIRNLTSSNNQISHFLLDPENSVIGVKEVSQNPIWTKSSKGKYLSKITNGDLMANSTGYAPCGNFYLVPSREFLENKTFLPAKINAYLIDDEGELIDIDTIEDFLLAEKILMDRTD